MRACRQFLCRAAQSLQKKASEGIVLPRTPAAQQARPAPRLTCLLPAARGDVCTLHADTRNHGQHGQVCTHENLHRDQATHTHTHSPRLPCSASSKDEQARKVPSDRRCRPPPETPADAPHSPKGAAHIEHSGEGTPGLYHTKTRGTLEPQFLVSSPRSLFAIPNILPGIFPSSVPESPYAFQSWTSQTIP